MSKIKAKNNYTGQSGCMRMNCAQSVMSAFQEAFDIEDETVEAFRAFGGGRAPAGLCGAYYAAKCVLDRFDGETAEQLKQIFLEQAGALECHNIRGLRKLSCVGCVEKSSEFLEELLQKSQKAGSRL